MAYVIEGPLGVDITKEYAASSTAPQAVDAKLLPPYALGTKIQYSDGRIFRFVKSAAAKTLKLAYLIDEDFLVGNGVTTSNDDGVPVGIPRATTTAPTSLDANADSAYFWIQTGGEASVTASAAAADAAKVCSGAVAGKLDDGDTSGLQILGAQWTAAATASDEVGTIFCSGEYRFIAA